MKTELNVVIEELSDQDQTERGMTGYSVAIESVNVSGLSKDVVGINASGAFISNLTCSHALDQIDKMVAERREELKKIEELSTPLINELDKMLDELLEKVKASSKKKRGLKDEAKQALNKIMKEDDLPKDIKEAAQLLYDRIMV